MQETSTSQSSRRLVGVYFWENGVGGSPDVAELMAPSWGGSTDPDDEKREQ